MSEMKNKLFAWIKKNRYYIVLALCILSVSGTYLLLSRAPANLPQYSTPDVQSDNEAANEPLPDLADYFPPELEPDVIEEKRNAESTQNALPAETPDSALHASADAPEVEKEPLVYVWPVEGEIQKPFSGNTLVYSATMSDWRAHTGTDIRADVGTDICACADGIIEQVYTDPRMGVTIVIDHENGLKSVYANLSNGNLVQEGKRVSAGEVISTVGTSALFEAAEESHLHLEFIKDDERIDPASVLY